MDARFDSANSRYGLFPGRVRAHHAWTNGLVVARVSPDGPGDKAGLQTGDIILGVGGDGVHTQAEFYRKVWERGGAGTDITLRVLQGIDVHDVTVHSIDRVEYFRPRTTY